jgi:hypothetical protein
MLQTFNLSLQGYSLISSGNVYRNIRVDFR